MICKVSSDELGIYTQGGRRWLESGDRDGLLSEVAVDIERGEGGCFRAENCPVG